jgi:hypothetical protein
VRLFGSQRRFRGLPTLATRQHAEPAEKGPVEKMPCEPEALQSLARALLAARLGEALVFQAARSCRMDDLQQVVRR